MNSPQLVQPSGRVRTEGGTNLAYYDFGSGPAILMFNGWSCVLANLILLADALKKDFRVIIWDYKGHGRSEIPTEYEYVNIPAFASDAHKIMTHLGIEKAALLGYSMGAQIALEFASRYPDKTEAVITLSGIFGRVFDSFLGMNLFSYIVPQLYRGIPHLSKFYDFVWKTAMKIPFPVKFGAGKLFLLDPELCRAEDFRPFVDEHVRQNGAMMLHLAAKMHEHSNDDDLQNLAAPALLICGSNDLFALPILSEKLSRRLRNSQLVVLEKGYHNSNLERPAEIAEHVSEFLNGRVLRR